MNTRTRTRTRTRSAAPALPANPREPSLREILASRGIEPTGQERNRRRREARKRGNPPASPAHVR